MVVAGQLELRGADGGLWAVGAKMLTRVQACVSLPLAIKIVLQIPGQPPQRLVWTDKHPKSVAGCGVLRFKNKGDLLDGETFIRLRDDNGARLQTSHPQKVCLAMGLPVGCGGVEEKSDW